MMQMKAEGLVARVSQIMAKTPDGQTASLRDAARSMPGMTGPERRARLALRIVLARSGPPPCPVPPPAPVLETAPPAAEVTHRADIPAPVAAPPQDIPKPETPKPRKPARMSMSTVRLEDAAMLLGAAFASAEDEPPARPASQDSVPQDDATGPETAFTPDERA